MGDEYFVKRPCKTRLFLINNCFLQAVPSFIVRTRNDSSNSVLDMLNKASSSKEDVSNSVLKQSIRVDKSGNVRVLTKVTTVNTKIDDPLAGSSHDREKPRSDVYNKSRMLPNILSKSSSSTSPKMPRYFGGVPEDETDSNFKKKIKVEKLIEDKLLVQPNCPNLDILDSKSKSSDLFDMESTSRNAVSGLIKTEKCSDFIGKSCTGNDVPGPSTKTPSSWVTLADMREVSDLITMCKEIARKGVDFEVVEHLHSKLKKISVNSCDDLVTYSAFVKSIFEKISQSPDKLHTHLHEFYRETCQKSKAVCHKKKGDSITPSTSKGAVGSSPAKLYLTSESDSDSKLQAKIKAIENKIKILTKKIDVLNNKDMSLDEMDDESPFALIGAYEKKIMELWNYLCKLTNSDTSTSRFIDAKFRFEGTRYPEINRAIVKLVRRLKPEVPDYSDVLKVVTLCDRKYGLHMPDMERNDIAQDILKMVIEELHGRRKNDLIDTLDCYMTYGPETAPLDDPAKTDPELKVKLDESRRLGKIKTEEVLSHFVQKQDEMKEKEDPSKADRELKVLEEQEDEEEDNETETESIDDEELLKIENEDAAKDNYCEEKMGATESKDASSETKSDDEDSESTDYEDDLDVDGSDSDECPPSPKKIKLGTSKETESNLKIVSVEGAGNLFYTFDNQGRENFTHYKKGEEDSDDSDVIVLD
ncbi:hypothetical protein CHUAL_010004 [Chamberlinius hualienensis]